jgi:hypothetical protein
LRFFLACLWVSLSCASQHDPDLEEKLSTIIQQDCNPLVRKCGAFIYQRFTTHRHVELHTRKLNGGRLPLSSQAKVQVVENLCNHFEHKEDAIYYFRRFAGEYMLYPLSIKKTVAMIEFHYEEQINSSAIIPAKEILHAKSNYTQAQIITELGRLSAHRSMLYEQLQKVRQEINRREYDRQADCSNDFRSIALQDIPEMPGHGFEENDGYHS